MAKLLWDPSRDVEALVSDFVWGYYQNSAPAILRYYDLLEDTRIQHLSNEMERAKQDLEGSGIRYNMNSQMFSKEFLQQATEILEKAEKMAETDTIRHRVEVAQLPIMYVKLMQGQEVAGGEYGEILDKFERVARSEGINYLSDQGGGPDTEGRIQAWREQGRNGP